MTKNITRKEFREQCFNRDNHTCVVPWCDEDAEDAHHIIERAEWEDGGYIPQNGASVCEKHHRHAEENEIPPQAFWLWIGIDNPITPSQYGLHINKWGDSFDVPPWKEHRERIKYPSSRHLPFSNIGDKDDTYYRNVDTFLDIPLVMTHKIDGSNAMIIKDIDNPVRARNGKQANHDSFDLLKDMYWDRNLHEKMTDNIQVFGEWTYAKHSIHYGCDCEEECVDIGPNLSDLVGVDDERAYFQVFGVYHMEYDIWLSWPKVEEVADELGLPTVPVIYVEENDEPTYTNKNMLYDEVYNEARKVVDNGGEGIVIRTKYPYHYGQFEMKLGKYVRKNHVKTDKHWKNQRITPNRI